MIKICVYLKQIVYLQRENLTYYKMKKEIIEKNFENYRNGLVKILGNTVAEAIINDVGGEQALANASFTNLSDSGAAYDGSLIKNIIKINQMAKKINGLLPDNMKVPEESLFKVCMLSQISKAVMFERNDNNWEVEKRGILYKFTDVKGALRTGERSILIAMNAGVKFTVEEYEAMKICDRMIDDDNMVRFFSSPLSVVVKQAIELTILTNKESVINE